MKGLRKICHELQPQIDKEIDRLLKECKVKYKTEGISGYIANVKRGYARHDGRFTVPLWAYDKRYEGKNYRGDEGYFTYYVAHELAHQLRYVKYGKSTGHDENFYEVFMNICPKHLQKFELHYIKTSSQYGIGE